MSPINEQILIDYLDNRLKGEERLQAEQLIREDADAAKELEDLLFSVDLIREAAVLQEVSAVRKAFNAGAKVIPMQKKNSAVVRSFPRNAMRVAVTVLLLVGAATLYKYSITNASSVYDKNFTSFELNTSRGNNDDGKLEKAYRSKNWTAVENIYTTQKENTARSCFLAGMAELELKNYNKAIVSFTRVMVLNSNKENPLYGDEAEYYLAMGYLGANKPAEAVTILKKIRNDKNHLFYAKASTIPALDLKLLELKK